MADDDSDAEHELETPNPAKWLLFEKAVKTALAKLDPDADVRHNVAIVGDLSGQTRQIDVLIKGTLAGQELSIAVECKRYSRKLGIGAVDEFAGKLLDLGVDRGILYAYNGLTVPAQARAQGSRAPKIVLGDPLPGPEHVEVDWNAVLSDGFGDCPNENCLTGDVGWFWWRTSAHEQLRAGKCDTCGSWCVVCPDCGEAVSFFWNDSRCSCCGVAMELVEDRKGADVELIGVGDDNRRDFVPTWERAPAPREGEE